ncbi:DEAD/DEAH box helicase [Bacillus sp. B1-b2]|uniref:DEAD/DEAH box helicase n=1 Tax=Bacillus sp. B1-b2 TaxID=2653201 RepID=UPI001261FA8F|nr:AAA domain-containing protein [Bacillus sp. B1-b2]KAB7671174.1 AAA family ATPase [Bacillus sp. B1-b2]
MTNIISTIKEWQEALQQEINFLKRHTPNSLAIYNGKLLNTGENYTYYFESISLVKIPIGSSVTLNWYTNQLKGRILSSDGKSLIIHLEKMIGEEVSEATLFHDPWELLEQLQVRFDSIKKNKRKLSRIIKLMKPSEKTKHPTINIQNHVHELALRSKYNPITFVWGPPGTGKTYTLARVALQRYWKGKRILLLAQSNQAVDVLLKEITQTAKLKNRFKVGDILRYGGNTSDELLAKEQITTSSLLTEKDVNLAKQKSELLLEKKNLKVDLAMSFTNRDSSSLLKLEEKLALVLERIRKRELQFVEKAMIIGTTLAKAATDAVIYEEDYDLVILDEASMAYVPQVAFTASLAKNTIICGDFKQLPPIAASRQPLVEKWLKNDIFHASNVADRVDSKTLHPQLLLLNEQRRMHPSISAFTNKYVYHSLVADHKSVENTRKTITEKAPFIGEANILLDSSNMGHFSSFEKGTKSRINILHSLLALQVMNEAIQNNMESIGYVTPYRAQAELMEGMANEFFPLSMQNKQVTVATVHRFQGSERDMIIFDSVESEPLLKAGMLLTGRDSERLLNVAITRSKGKFIHIGNREFIKRKTAKQSTIHTLIKHQEEENTVLTSSAIGSWIKDKNPKLFWTHAQKTELLQRDLQRAENEVFIALPEDTILSNSTKGLLSPYKPLLIKDLNFPIVIIKETIVWLGYPLEAMKGVKPPSIGLRVYSPTLSSYLLKWLDK